LPLMFEALGNRPCSDTPLPRVGGGLSEEDPEWGTPKLGPHRFLSLAQKSISDQEAWQVKRVLFHKQYRKQRCTAQVRSRP
jgi:hypothetical protein